MTTISIKATKCIPGGKKSPHRLRIQNHFRKSSGVLIATMTLHSSLIYSINLHFYFNQRHRMDRILIRYYYTEQKEKNKQKQLFTTSSITGWRTRSGPTFMYIRKI